jgi:hypothetical protein
MSVMAAKDYFLANIWWKLAALLVATFTWFAVQFAIWNGQDDRHSQILSQQPVRILTAPGDAGHFRADPASVDVVVRTTTAGLRNLARQNIQVFVDLTNAPEESSFIRELRVHCPEEVQVIRTDPKAVFIERIAPANLPQKENTNTK